jgi:hypothetical protein
MRRREARRSGWGIAWSLVPTHRSRSQGAPLLTRFRAFLYSPRGLTASL